MFLYQKQNRQKDQQNSETLHYTVYDIVFNQRNGKIWPKEQNQSIETDFKWV